MFGVIFFYSKKLEFLYAAKLLICSKNYKKRFLSCKSAYYMISEGSCDTEDWSNNAENSALPSQELTTFYNREKQKTVIVIILLTCDNISQYC